MAKIVITKDRGVWRVSRRVLGTSAPVSPGLVIARALVRLVIFPVLWIANVLGMRPWRVEARTVDARPVVWYVRGTRRAGRVAREAIDALVEGRPLDDVLPAITDRESTKRESIKRKTTKRESTKRKTTERKGHS